MASDVTFDNNNSGVQIGINYGNAEIHIYKESSDTTLDQQCLRDLRVTNPQDDKGRIESFKGGLLKDSYRWILNNKDFMHWQQTCEQDNNEDGRLLWIKADPGKGKTMLLCGIINELQTKTTEYAALSFFFCEADEPKLRTATCVLRGLIFLLVENRPNLLSHVRRRWDYEGKYIFEDRNAWEALSKIFADILKDDGLRSVIFILDALDECTSGRSRLIELVKRSSATPKVNWIVSSRDWPEIEEQLLMSSFTVLSLEMNQESITDAVNAFIRFKVDRLAKQKSYDLHTRDVVESYLTSNSNETFLWVALVCEELLKTSSWRAEEKLKTFSSSLTDFYQRMIERIDQSDDVKLCKEILATASTACRSLKLDELQLFVALPFQSYSNHRILRHIVNLCGSFLSIRGDVVLFIHQSARDFLLDNRSLFPSGVSAEHRRILHVSLRIMKRTLRQDIYGLRHPASGYIDSLGDITPPTPDPLAPVRYASVYWIDHLLSCDLKFNTRAVLKETFAIASFLSQKFFHWLEGLCILRYAWRGIEMMLKMDGLLRNTPIFTDLSSLVTDACLFLHRHRTSIERYPLQIYSSSLVFSPDNSFVKKFYESQRPSWIMKPPVMQDTWNPCTHTIERSDGCMVSLTWSQDGSHLVYVTDESSLITLDSDTGHSVASVTLEGRDLNWTSFHMGWSFDKSKIASLEPNGLMVWSCHTGKCLQSITANTSDSYRVTGICWSKDEQKIAVVGFSNGENSLSSLTVFGLFDNQHAHPQSTEFPEQRISGAFWSHHQDWLVLVEKSNQAVIMWDINAGTLIKTVHLHDQYIDWGYPNFAYFESPNNQLLATQGSDNRSIRVWSLVTGEILYKLDGLFDGIQPVGWSPDGKQIATRSDDSVLRIWDPSNGNWLYSLVGGERMSQVCWSPDPKRLASAQWGSWSAIKIWEPGFINNAAIFDLAVGPPQRVSWSPDNIQVAIVYRHSIQIWNLATTTLLFSIKCDCFFYPAISWSPDGSLLAVTPGDRTIEIWNTVNRQCIHQLDHSPKTESTMWSHSGSHILSLSSDRRHGQVTVRVWHLATQQYVEFGHDFSRASRADPVNNRLVSHFPLSWSFDDERAASACYDHILIFDPVTGEIVQTIWHDDNDPVQGIGTNIVESMAWSPRGDQFASASHFLIRIWNPITSECLKKVESSGIWFLQYDIRSPNLLKTTLGTIDLDALKNLNVHDSQDLEQEGPAAAVPVGYGMEEDHSWITWKGEPLLWLPPECRPFHPSSLDISGERVTIGTRSGHIRVFWLAPDPTSMLGSTMEGRRD